MAPHRWIAGREPTRRRRLPPPSPFYRLSARVERLLVEVVLALGLAVALGQCLLTLPAARYVMSYVDRLEGVPLGADRCWITIAMKGGDPAEAAHLRVNDREAASFAFGEVRVAVEAGDLLEVDGTGLAGQGRFEVVGAGGGVMAPTVGACITTNRDVVSLGRVTLVAADGGD